MHRPPSRDGGSVGRAKKKKEKELTHEGFWGITVVSPQVVPPKLKVVSPQLKLVSPQLKLVSPQLKVVSPQLKVVSPQFKVV